VIYSGDQRDKGWVNTGVYAMCTRHYFMFGGLPCTDPGDIGGISYLNKHMNLHRPIMSKCCDSATE